MEATVDVGGSVGVNWSELPTDLLVMILKRLRIVEYIRFGAVCTTWNLLTKSERRPPPPWIPWLMFPASNDDGRGGCSCRSLFDVSNNETYTMYLPELHGRQCIGTSADGSWVVFIKKDLELGMLNIFAREQQQLTLPPLTTLWDVKGVVLDKRGRIAKYHVQLNLHPSVVETTPSLMFKTFYHKVIMFQISSEVQEPPVVAFVHGPLGKLSVARVGDKAWTKLDVPLGTMDAIFHGGRLYVLNFNGDVVTFDLCNSSSFTWSDARPLGPPVNNYEFYQKYLVSLSNRSDDVVQIWRDVQFVFDPTTDEPKAYRTSRVKTFKLDLVKKQWVELNDLGGYTFFLGHNYSVALPPREFSQLRRNCIYFTDDNMETMLHSTKIRCGDRDLGVFSFEESSWEALPLPGTIVNFPSPIWVTPSMV